MAHTTATISNLGILDQFRSFVAALRGKFAEQAEFRTTYNELSRLTDRELADIGLCRRDIGAVCRGTYRR